MKREAAIDAAGHAIYTGNPERSAGRVSRERGAEIVAVLEALGVLRFDGAPKGKRPPDPLEIHQMVLDLEECGYTVHAPGTVTQAVTVPAHHRRRFIEEAVRMLPSDLIGGPTPFTEEGRRDMIARRICEALGV